MYKVARAMAQCVCTRETTKDPEAVLCFGMAPNGEFLKIRKNRHQRHQNGSRGLTGD